MVPCKSLVAVSSSAFHLDTCSDKVTSPSQPEFAHPYAVLAPHAEISVASPAGGEAPLDLSSVELFKEDPVCTTFHQQQSHLWKNTDKLENYIGKAAGLDLIFVVGGHGRTYTATLSNTNIA